MSLNRVPVIIHHYNMSLKCLYSSSIGLIHKFDCTACLILLSLSYLKYQIFDKIKVYDCRLPDHMDFLQHQRDVPFLLFTRVQFPTLPKESGSVIFLLICVVHNFDAVNVI